MASDTAAAAISCRAGTTGARRGNGVLLGKLCGGRSSILLGSNGGGPYGGGGGPLVAAEMRGSSRLEQARRARCKCGSFSCWEFELAGGTLWLFPAAAVSHKQLGLAFTHNVTVG